MKRIALALITLLGCHDHGDNGKHLPVPAVAADGADGAESADGADGADSANGADSADGTEGADNTDARDGGASCTADADCDDGLACTTDACEDSACKHSVAADACLVSATCLAAGEPGPEPCLVCDPAQSQSSLTPAAGPCDDGEPCTEADSCSEGACVGGPEPECDDGLPCTTDACALEVGCVHVSNDEPCDDGDACTEGDTCLLGLCVAGATQQCDDENPCSADSCAEGACVNDVTAFEGQPCDDGDACVGGTACSGGACGGGLALACDDGNACTIDYCDTLAGCGSLPTESPCCTGVVSVCDDGDPCTADVCDPVTTDCTNQPMLAGTSCDDGEPCTSGDVCDTDGVCDGAVTACDDGNVCTSDVCLLGEGCKGFPVEGACDDGLECSTGDTCVLGLCKADTTACGCVAPHGVDAAKVASLQISTTSETGAALDLDGDPTTCAPSGSCSGGVHNSFSVLAGLANTALADSIAGGSIVLLVTAPAAASGAFDLVLYQGELDPANAACDLNAATCDYLIDAASFDDACKARFVLPATLSGTKLSAGSVDSQIPFSIPIQGITLEVVVYAARLEGEVTLDGGNITAFTGVLGGAISQSALFTAIDNLPAEGLPVPKDLIKTILQTSLEYDIDTDGDDKGDAASIGLTLSGIDAALTGVAP